MGTRPILTWVILFADFMVDILKAFGLFSGLNCQLCGVTPSPHPQSFSCSHFHVLSPFVTPDFPFQANVLQMLFYVLVNSWCVFFFS